MKKYSAGWALVTPAGEIHSFSVTKRGFLNSPINSRIHKQVWKKEATEKGGWSGELKMIVPRVFRDVWPGFYRKGWRFVRAQETIITGGNHA